MTWTQQLWRMDAWALVASGIFPDQGSNSCPLPWQGHSYPLYHQGSTSRALFKCALHIATSFYRLQYGKWGSKNERSQGDSWGMLPWPDDELNLIVIIAISPGCAEQERAEWRRSHAATELARRDRSSPLTSLAGTCPGSPFQWVRAPSSIKFRVRVVFPTYTLTQTFLSPLNDQGLWLQGAANLQAITAGFKVQEGPHKHTGCPQCPGISP